MGQEILRRTFLRGGIAAAAGLAAGSLPGASAAAAPQEETQLASYMIVDHLILQNKRIRLTASGYVRGAILAGILVSGLLLVIRNLAGSRFAPGFIILLDLTHLGLVMAFLMAAGYCLIFKKQWTNAR